MSEVTTASAAGPDRGARWRPSRTTASANGAQAEEEPETSEPAVPVRPPRSAGEQVREGDMPMTVPITMATRLRRRGRRLDEVLHHGAARVIGRDEQPSRRVEQDARPPEHGQCHEGDPDDDHVDVEVVGQPGRHAAQDAGSHVAAQHRAAGGPRRCRRSGRRGRRVGCHPPGGPGSPGDGRRGLSGKIRRETAVASWYRRWRVGLDFAGIRLHEGSTPGCRGPRVGARVRSVGRGDR